MYQENLHAPADVRAVPPSPRSASDIVLIVYSCKNTARVPFLYCSKSIIINSIHTKSRYNSHPIREVLQEQAKKLRKAVYETIEEKK